jgi:hypothetical protein
MKLASRDCHADHLSSRYEKILTGRSLFSAKCVEKFLSSYLYAIYPKNETLSLVDPVPPKASRYIGGMGIVGVHKKLLKIFWPFGVRLARCCAGSVYSYIGGYVLKYVIKCIVIPCYL